MENDQVRQLAETLMKTGMASSIYDATEKAKSILNVKSQKPYDSGQAQQNKPMEKQQPVPNIGVDIKDENATLNELMREIGIDPEKVEEQEKEQKQGRLDDAEKRIGGIKEEMKEAGNNPEKFERIKEEIAEVNEELDDIEADVETKNEEQAENTDEGQSERIEEDQLNIDDELQSLELEQQAQQPEQQNQEDEQQDLEQEDDFEEEEKE